MKQTLRQRLLSHYPAWHDKPMRLTLSEMENPELVLDEFFEMYHLSSIRMELKQWLDDALSASDIYPMDCVTLHDYVEKLVEAAFVLYEKSKIQQENEDTLEDNNEEPVDAEEDVDEKEETDPTCPTKNIRLLDKVKADPYSCLKEIFHLSDLTDLKENLQTWLKVALSNDAGIYEEAKDRATLITFIDHLLPLLEAIYLINETYQMQEITGWKDKLPKGLRMEIEKNSKTTSLSAEQIHHPHIVIEAFFKKFTISYCRRELWDLLDAVISYDGEAIEGFSKINLLIYYECYLCIVEAGRGTLLKDRVL